MNKRMNTHYVNDIIITEISNCKLACEFLMGVTRL